MKDKRSSICLTLGLLMMAVLPIRADDAQDAAEAKSRGITVAQVQAERVLAAEKQKTADAEKVLADLNKQLGELQAARAATAPAATTASDGSAVYKDFVKRYLAGNWDKLAADITARQKEIAALPQANQDDLTYIQQAVTESRQAWWNVAKSGKAAQFKATVWKDTVTVNYSNGPGGRVPMTAGNVALAWPSAEMDSFDAMSMADVGLAMNGNFHKGDEIQQIIWSNLAVASVYQSMGADKIRTLTPAERAQLSAYSGFWSGVTTGYYGTPAARRLMMVQAMASFEPINDERPDWLGKRPIGSAILIEMKAHKDVHPVGEGMVIVNLDQAVKDPHQYEMFKAKLPMMSMPNAKLAFEEDKAYREMFKTLGEKNMSWSESKISLPADLSYDLNMEADTPLAEERKAYLAKR